MKLIEFSNHKNQILRGLFSPARLSRGIIFIHGLERNTTEYKFRNFWQALEGRANLFRFDFSGCGLSEGAFDDFTIEKSTEELALAVAKFKSLAPAIKNLALVGHSIAGAIALNYTQEPKNGLDRMVLLGPAFNQGDLLKYYFVRSVYKGKKDITWSNFRPHFSAAGYKQFSSTKKHLRKAHYMSNQYFKENIELDYQDLFSGCQLDPKKILLIQSRGDVKVPVESNDKLPKSIKQIILSEADHDFECPDWVKEYLPQAIKFLMK